jgi:hypothetical protein
MKIAITSLDHIEATAPEIIEQYFGTHTFELAIAARQLTPGIIDSFWNLRRKFGTPGFNLKVSRLMVSWLSDGLGSGFFESYPRNILMVLPYSSPNEFHARLVMDGYYTWLEDAAAGVSSGSKSHSRFSRPFIARHEIMIHEAMPVLYGYRASKPHTMFFAPIPDYVPESVVI